MPTNTSAAAATQITTLPYSITFTPDAATQQLWWTYTPVDCEIVIGIRPWTSVAAYQPKANFYETEFLSSIASGTNYLGVEPTYFPVKPHVPVYIQISDNTTGTASGEMTLTVAAAPRRPVSAGDLVIQDDARYYPAAVRSKVDGSILRYIPVASGEIGTSAGHSMLVSDHFETNLVLYNRTGMQQLAEYPSVGSVSVMTQNRGTTYYIGDGTDFYKLVNTELSAMGYSLPLSNITGMAVDESGGRMYYTRTPTNGAIRRFNLSDGSGDAELVAAQGNYINSDLLVLADHTIIAGYNLGTAYTIRRFNGTGKELNRVAMSEYIYHLCNDVHPLRFWVWTLDDSIAPVVATFHLIDGTTMTAIRSFTGQTHSGGQFSGTGTATTPIFGHSESCTFWVIPEDCDVCGCECVCEPTTAMPTGLSGTNKGDDPTRVLAQWDAMCAYGGTVPTGTNGTDTEDWAD